MNQKFKTHCKWLLIAPYLLLLANSVMAQQVFKCTNQHGRTVYSDRPCKEADRKAETIRAVPNTLDMTEARAQELRARIRQDEDRERQAQENALRRQAQEIQAQYERSRQPPPAPVVKPLSQEPRKKRRAEAPMPMHQAPPAQIVNCDPAGCWDTAGRRLNNAAGGNFFRSDGRFCTNNGTAVICH